MTFLGTRGWDVKAWKYRLADRLNRLPRWCWTRLVCWVEYDAPLSDAATGERCRRDAEADGSCYCSKFRRSVPGPGEEQPA